MSAEYLRETARMMRETANAATPGPWRPQGDKVRGTSADSLIEDNLLIAYAGAHHQRLGMKHTGRGTPVPEHAPDVEHVAAWHPGAASAVADLLDDLARMDDETAIELDQWPAAVAVARAWRGDA